MNVESIQSLMMENSKLQKELEFARTFLESTNSIVLRWDRDGIIHFINDFGLRFFGYSSEELVGQHLMKIVPKIEKSTGRDMSLLAKDIAKNPEQHKSVPSENITKNGRTVWVTWTNKGLLDEQGNVKEILAVGNDITALKQAEISLWEYQEKLNAALESMDDAVFISDSYGSLVHLNNAFAIFHRFKNKDECTSQLEDYPKVLDVFLADGTPAPLEQWAIPKALRGESATDFEYTCHRKDTGDTWVGSYNFSPFFDRQGNIAGAVVVARDITERKKVEEALQRSNKDLRLAQRIANIGNWTLDPEIGVPEWSDEIYRIYERNHELGPYALDDYKKVYKGEWLEKFTFAIHRAAHEGQPYDLELKLELAPDNVKWVHSICEPERKTASNGYFLRGTIQDITQIKQAEIQLRQSQKIESIGQLAAGIAHDFNNLLSVIVNNMELLRLNNQSGAPFDENVEQVNQASDRAKELVSQILAFSRQEELALVPVDLTITVGNTLKFVRSMIPSSVEMMTAISEEPLIINADSTQLQQVLINLCTNAVDAMNERGLLQIKLEEEDLTEKTFAQISKLPSGQYAKLSITDSGEGIDKETLNRIFDPFFTTKAVGVGTGMGLSVVHGIVEQHGGMILVDSTLGQGSTFTLYFPITGNYEVTHMSVAEEALPTGTERILLVDDEPCVADSCGALLEDPLGYKVTVMIDSVEALEFFNSHPHDFDLVITDQTMPKMSGVELSKELLKTRPEIPIILCSGYSAKVTEEDAKGLGISAFCMKPLLMEQLALSVRDVLDNRDPS